MCRQLIRNAAAIPTSGLPGSWPQNTSSIPISEAPSSPLRRNVLTSTLDLTGVRFLNGPRNDSPLISRLKVRTSEHMDFEWDADYDFKTNRLDASNVFADYRRDSVFGSVGYSTLQALNGTFTANLASQVTKYNLLRLLLGYGAPTKRGLSVPPTPATTSLRMRCSMAASRPPTTGTAVAWLSNTAAWLSARCETRTYIASTSPLREWARAGNLTHSERIF